MYITISAQSAVKTDRKWRCKQIYSCLEGVYW